MDQSTVPNQTAHWHRARIPCRTVGLEPARPGPLGCNRSRPIEPGRNAERAQILADVRKPARRLSLRDLRIRLRARR